VDASRSDANCAKACNSVNWASCNFSWPATCVIQYDGVNPEPRKRPLASEECLIDKATKWAYCPKVKWSGKVRNGEQKRVARSRNLTNLWANGSLRITCGSIWHS